MKFACVVETVAFAAGFNILRRMQSESNCTKFLYFVAALISTGTRGIVRDMRKHKMFDVVITTCGALDHDIAKSYDKYYAGDFRMDDEMLLKRNVHRLGNVLVPMDNYGPLIEEKVQSALSEMYASGKRGVATYEITDHIGSTLDESSFLYWAHKNKIPVIVPGIVDGAVGSQVWLFHQQHRDFKIDILKDQNRLSDIVFESKKTGAFTMMNPLLPLYINGQAFIAKRREAARDDLRCRPRSPSASTGWWSARSAERSPGHARFGQDAVGAGVDVQTIFVDGPLPSGPAATSWPSRIATTPNGRGPSSGSASAAESVASGAK